MILSHAEISLAHQQCNKWAEMCCVVLGKAGSHLVCMSFSKQKNKRFRSIGRATQTLDPGRGEDQRLFLQGPDHVLGPVLLQGHLQEEDDTMTEGTQGLIAYIWYTGQNTDLCTYSQRYLN